MLRGDHGRSPGPKQRDRGTTFTEPAFFRLSARCIDVDKTRTAINHRVPREKKESSARAQGIPVTLDRASSPAYLYHRLIMDHYPARFVRRLNEPVTEYESADAFTDYSKGRPGARQRVPEALLLRILGRGILSRRWPDTTTTKRAGRAINHRLLEDLEKAPSRCPSRRQTLDAALIVRSTILFLF